MKPILLKIRGLNSFIEQQTIDFEKLTADGIFGISGKTGSGKTTIIDAITLALYGEMARFEKKPERQFVNMNSDDAWVEFTFQVNVQGMEDTYVAERLYKNPTTAKKKKSEKDSYGRLYRINNGTQTVLADRENEVTKKIEKIIGLEYNDFVRSVVLPQGKFNEFLLLENKDRRLMLQRIFGFERYGEELLKRVSEKRKTMTAKLEEAENSVLRYEDLSEEKINSVKQNLSGQEDKLIIMKRRNFNNTKELEKTIKLRDLANEYAAYVKELDALKLEEAQIKSCGIMLETGQRSAEVVQAAKTVKEGEIRVAALERKLSDIIKKEEALELVFKSLKEKQEKLLDEKEKKHPELIRFEERLLNARKLDEEIRELKTEREELLKSYGEESGKLKKLEEKCIKLKEKYAVLEEDISKLQKAVDSMEITSGHRERISKCGELYRKLDEVAIRIAAYEVKVKLSKENKDLLIEKISRFKKEQEVAKSKIEVVNSECEKLRDRLNLSATARFDNAVSLLVMKLKDGDPCPICGSIEHPLTAEVAFNHDVKELLSENNIKKWEKQLADKEIEKVQVTEKAAALSADLAALAESVKNVEAVLAEHESEIKTCDSQRNSYLHELSSIGGELTTSLEKLKAELQRIKKNDESRPDYQKRLISLNADQNNLRIELEKISLEILEAKNNLHIIFQSGTDKKGLIQRKTSEVQDITGGTGTIDKRLEQIKKEKADLFSVCEKILRDADQAEKQYKNVKENRMDLQSQKRVLDELITNERQHLTAILSLKGFSRIEDAEAGLLTDDKKKELELIIKNYNDRLGRVSVNLDRITKSTGFEQIKDVGRIEDINKKAFRLEAERDAETLVIEECTKNIGKLRSDIETMEKQLKELTIIKKRVISIKSETDLLADLATLLRGAEFVEYLSKKQLAFLTGTATRRLLKMTSGRYALELDDRDFTIRDNHNGGKRRSPKTLSGGETFIASLCLALALSTKIQMSKNASMEFFFLDEGFGSLDKLALDTVFDALEQLRTEKIKVGVISHVDELKSRLPSILCVTPAENGVGSRVSIE